MLGWADLLDSGMIRVVKGMADPVSYETDSEIIS